MTIALISKNTEKENYFVQKIHRYKWNASDPLSLIQLIKM